MRFDPALVPFSRRGAYVALSALPAASGRAPGLYWRSVRGPATGGRPLQELFEIQLLRDGVVVPTEIEATPAVLRLKAADASAEFCFSAPDQMRIRLTGATLVLRLAETGAYDTVLEAGPGRWLVVCNTIVETKLMCTAAFGHIAVDAPWEAERVRHIALALQPVGGVGDFTIDEFVGTWRGQAALGDFDESVRAAEAEFVGWVAPLPAVPAALTAARELAGYVL